MSDKRRVIFHIGLEKTGSSSLQACLHGNEAILKRHSILYPRRNLAYGFKNHKRLAACYGSGDGDRWFQVDPSRRARTVASIIDEIETAPERTAVISAEHFSSRLRQAQIEALRGDFQRFDCRVVLVLRDHLSRLTSHYATYVSNGGFLTLDEYAGLMMLPGAADLRYVELVERWEQAFGRDRITLIGYSPEVVKDVLASLAPGIEAEPDLKTFRLNRSARVDVVAALRLANAAAADRGSDNNGAWIADTQLSGHIKTWLVRCADASTPARWSIECDRLQRLRDMAQDDAAGLRGRYGLILEPHDEMVTSTDGIDAGGGAELLARALVARATKPWTRPSLIGTGRALLRGARSSMRRTAQR